MSDNLKIQKFNIIIIKKVCQKIKVCYFCYINCERQPNPGRFLCIVNARPSNLWCFEKIYHTIFIYGKMLIIEFSYNFLYVWNCMKLYDKKFLIYGNCMIRSFGQPGKLDFTRILWEFLWLGLVNCNSIPLVSLYWNWVLVLFFPFLRIS